MSPGRRSPRLGRAILEQSCCHARSGEPTAEVTGSSMRSHHDLIVTELDVDLVAGFERCSFADVLGDHDLSLWPDPRGYIE
jgi:hypothetical protein